MDLESEKDRLLDLFNQHGEYYTANSDGVDMIEILSIDSDTICTILRMDGTHLFIESLNRCDVEHGGSIHLHNIIEFARGHYTTITLDDFSELIFLFNQHTEPIHIDLRAFRILRDGITWYQTFGFSNVQLEENANHISEFITKPLVELQFDKQAAHNLYYYTSVYDLEEDLTVSDFIKFIDEELKEKCPLFQCENNEETYEFVSITAEFINQLYKKMVGTFDSRVLPQEMTYHFGKKRKNKEKSRKSKQLKKKSRKSKQLKKKSYTVL